ncbi:MAG: hypothetical protein KDG55_06880 [Rhodocyclaceae bacterium]|nr:hypothetical protein [Rhodocyclaceae bacterium]
MRLPLLPLVLALTLSACGGGGEVSFDSGGGSGGGDNTSEAAITGSNMETVAGMSVSLARADLSSVSEAGDAVTGVRTQPASRLSIAQAAALAVRMFRSHARAGLPADSVAGITVDRTENCDQSGSVRISITSDDSNLLTLDPGDRLVLDFASCRQDDQTVDGRLSLTVLSLSGRLDDVGNGSVSARFTDLSFSDGVDRLTANGTMTIGIDVADGRVAATGNSQDMRYELGVAGDDLVITVREGSISFTENALTGTTVTLSEDFVAVSVDFDGVARIGTEIPLAVDPAHQILSGKLRVDGLDSVLFLTFLAAGEVLLELDDDDDGLIDITRLTTVGLLPFGLP